MEKDLERFSAAVSGIFKKSVFIDVEERFHRAIKRVIFNDPATIVFWVDGMKTVVKAQEGETFDKEKGLALAIAKKFFGNQGNYYNDIKKWL